MLVSKFDLSKCNLKNVINLETAQFHPPCLKVMHVDSTNVVSEGLQTLQGLKHNDGLLE